MLLAMSGWRHAIWLTEGVADFGFRQVIQAHAVAGMTGESYHRCVGFPPLASPLAAVIVTECQGHDQALRPSRACVKMLLLAKHRVAFCQG